MKMKHACKKRKKESLIAFVEQFLAKDPPEEPLSGTKTTTTTSTKGEKQLLSVQGAIKILNKPSLLAEIAQPKLLFVTFPSRLL